MLQNLLLIDFFSFHVNFAPNWIHDGQRIKNICTMKNKNFAPIWIKTNKFCLPVHMTIGERWVNTMNFFLCLLQ